MTRLDREPAIQELAADLGCPVSKTPVQDILTHCRRKVHDWTANGDAPAGIQELQRVVCDRLGLTFEEIHSDEELDATIRKYVAIGEFVFAHARQSLDNWTFAELFERDNPTTEPDHFVAIIDCRGDEKFARRFFTKWHEIAHLLVLTPRYAPPFNRESTDRCPIERLMDVIAGDIGFYEPVFRPALERCVNRHGALTYAAIEELRAHYCPEASFHATALAAVRMYAEPAILVEARFALKASEQRALDAGAFASDAEKPQPKLRAVNVMPNDAAKAAGLRIDRNMEVPESSIIARAIQLGDETIVSGHENLATWTHSDGSPLPTANVTIDASATEERAIAVVVLSIS
jgi:hypothetical protein